MSFICRSNFFCLPIPLFDKFLSLCLLFADNDNSNPINSYDNDSEGDDGEEDNEGDDLDHFTGVRTPVLPLHEIDSNGNPVRILLSQNKLIIES